MKNTIKIERIKNGFTQQDLADKISVSRQTIIAIESGKFNPSTKLSLKIADVLKCNVQDIFSLESSD